MPSTEIELDIAILLQAFHVLFVLSWRFDGLTDRRRKCVPSLRGGTTKQSQSIVHSQLTTVHGRQWNRRD